MKLLCNLIVFLYLLTPILSSQRYLTSVFPNVIVSSDIIYGAAHDYKGDMQSLLLDFYEPLDDSEQQRPLIIYAHGGGFVDDTQDKSLVHIVAFCDSMTRKGYCVASINYRLDSIICNRAVLNAMHDMKAAVRFFKKERLQYKIDTNLLFVGGESAGAATALNTNYVNQDMETIYPLTSPLSDDLSVEGHSGNSGFNSRTRATLCYCGGTSTTTHESIFDTIVMQSMSDPPLLQIHGTADPLIPIARALDVSLRARNIGIPFLFYPLSGATHCPWFYPLENSWNYLDSLIELTIPFLYAAISETSTATRETKTEDVIIYPNPSDGLLNIDLTIEYTDTRLVQVMDISGIIVHRSLINSGVQGYKMNTNLERGLYFESVSSPKKVRLVKWIVK